MGRARSVLLILLLRAGSLSPPAAAQELRSTPPDRGKSFQLEPNYPKIVVSETYIPFLLDSALFRGRDTVVVSLRIYNTFRQPVAIPVAVTEGDDSRRPPLLNVAYSTPGRKMAFWDAKDLAGVPVPSGVYYLQLVVRGQPQPETIQIVVDNPRRRRTIPWLGGRNE